MSVLLLPKLVDRIKKELDFGTVISDCELLEEIEREVFGAAAEHRIGVNESRKLVQRIFHSFRGLDILQPLVDDRSITEIMVNAYDEIFIERDGVVERIPDAFENPDKLETIIQSIVGKVNRAVNEVSPIVDARLSDGSRVNVVLPPVALKGPAMTIRKFPERPMELRDLIAKDAISEEAADFLKLLVQAKYNIFISGGTGSGKTTFLNALSQHIPSGERVITIEDSAELQIRNVPNLVALETRNANTEGKGEITIRDLIRSSLRMRPNRIIVGEVRGAEAVDMLQAMNTGHEGSLSTGHANSSSDMLNRLETMIHTGAGLPVDVIRKNISSAIDILVHLARMRDSSRKVIEISEIAGIKHGDFVVNRLFEFAETGETTDGCVNGRLVRTSHRLSNVHKWTAAGLRKELLA